jgi:hypothetical protein
MSEANARRVPTPVHRFVICQSRASVHSSRAPFEFDNQFVVLVEPNTIVPVYSISPKEIFNGFRFVGPRKFILEAYLLRQATIIIGFDRFTEEREYLGFTDAVLKVLKLRM